VVNDDGYDSCDDALCDDALCRDALCGDLLVDYFFPFVVLLLDIVVAILVTVREYMMPE
jgi:hypothetical protein